MNNIPTTRRQALSRIAALAVIAATGVLAACGGSDDSAGTATIRLVHLSASASAFDLIAVDDDDDETVLASTVARDTASAAVSVTAGEVGYQLRRAGNDSAAVSTSWSLTEGVAYTAIAYGEEGSLKMAMLEEDEDEPDTGKARLRIFNASADAGALDLYLTDTDSDIDSAGITTTVASSSSSGFVTLSPGTRRLRLTASGSTSDLRLDLPAVALEAGQVVTLIVTAGPGGVLVHAATLVQGGDLAVYRNPSARVRLAAGVTGNGSVQATIGGQSVASGQRAPSVGSYRLIDAGSALALAVSVNGAALEASSVTLKAGGDYTLVVHGDASAAQVVTLTDDNRLPASSKARLRLVNALHGLDGGLTLNLDYSALAIDIGMGAASDYTTVSTATDVPLEVISPLSAAALYSIAEADILSQGVYTVFMLGDGSTSAYGALRKDR